MSLVLPWRSAGLAAAVALVVACPALAAPLRLERPAVEAGELWRVVTGHLVHGTTTHALWNLAALLVLGALFERELRGRMAALLLGGALVVGTGVLVLAPALTSYTGLSGVLVALFVAGALGAARRARREGERLWARLLEIALLAGLAKIAIEHCLGAPLFTDPASLGSPPLALAHALGALAGALVALTPSGLSFRRGGGRDGGARREPCGGIVRGLASSRIEAGFWRESPSRSTSVGPRAVCSSRR